MSGVYYEKLFSGGLVYEWMLVIEISNTYHFFVLY